MSRVLDAIRAQYPELDAVDDRQIALTLGKAQPDLFDQDPDFAEEFKIFEEEDRLERGQKGIELRREMDDLRTEQNLQAGQIKDRFLPLALSAEAASTADIPSQIASVQTFLGNVINPPVQHIDVRTGKSAPLRLGGPVEAVSDIFLESGRRGQEHFGKVRDELDKAAAGLNPSAGNVFASGLTRSAIGSMPAIVASPGGMPAVSVAAGLQQLGGTFDEAVREGMKAGLTRAEAEQEAVVPAGISGLTTALVTAAFGKTGIEKSLAGPKFTLPKGFAGSVREVAKQMGAEATEEATDEAFQSLIAQQTFKPDMTVEEAFKQVLHAAVAGGLLGGFFQTVSQTAGRMTTEGRTALIAREKEVAEGDEFAFPADESFPEEQIGPEPEPEPARPSTPTVPEEEIDIEDTGTGQSLRDFIETVDLGEEDVVIEEAEQVSSPRRVFSLRESASETGRVPVGEFNRRVPLGLPAPSPTIEDVDRLSQPPDPIRAGLRPRTEPQAATDEPAATAQPSLPSRPPEPLGASLREDAPSPPPKKPEPKVEEAEAETEATETDQEFLGMMVRNAALYRELADDAKARGDSGNERRIASTKATNARKRAIKAFKDAGLTEEEYQQGFEVEMQRRAEEAAIEEETEPATETPQTDPVLDKLVETVSDAKTNLAGPSRLRALTKRAKEKGYITDDDANEVARIQKDIGSKEDTSDAFDELEGILIGRQEEQEPKPKSNTSVASQPAEPHTIKVKTETGDYDVAPDATLPNIKQDTVPEPEVKAEPLPAAPKPRAVPGVDVDLRLAGVAASVVDRQELVDEAEARGERTSALRPLRGEVTKRRKTAVKRAAELGFTEAELDQAIEDVTRNRRESTEVLPDEESPSGLTDEDILIDAGLNEEDINDLEKFSRDTRIVDPVGDAKKGMIFFGGDWVVADQRIIANYALQEKQVIRDFEAGLLGSSAEAEAAVDQARRATLGAKRQYNATQIGRSAPVRTGEKLRNDIASLRELALKISANEVLDNEETAYLADIYDPEGRAKDDDRSELLERFINEADEALKVGADTAPEKSLDRGANESEEEYRERIFGIASEMGFDVPGLPAQPQAEHPDPTVLGVGMEVQTPEGEIGTIQKAVGDQFAVFFEEAGDVDFVPAEMLSPAKELVVKEVKVDPVKTREAKEQVKTIANSVKAELKRRNEASVQRLVEQVRSAFVDLKSDSTIPELDNIGKFILQRLAIKDSPLSVVDFASSESPRIPSFRNEARVSDHKELSRTLDVFAQSGLAKMSIVNGETVYRISDSGKKAADLMLTNRVKPGDVVDTDGNVTTPRAEQSIKRNNGSTLEPESGGLNIEAVEESISSIRENWERGAQINVVQNPNDLPQQVKDRITSEGYSLKDTEGVTDENGSVYLVAGNIASGRRAREVVFHETIGHRGIREVLGQAFDSFMEGVFNSHRGSAETEDIVKLYNLDVSALAGRVAAGSEFVARSSENGNIHKIFLWDALVGKVRRWLKKAGFNLTVTDGDIRRALARAVDLQSRRPDKTAEVQPETVEPSRGEQPKPEGKSRVHSTINEKQHLLSYQTTDVINALLKTDILTDEQWEMLNLSIEQQIEGGLIEGSIEMDAGSILLRIADQADPEVFPHEIFHLAYEMLPAEDRAVINGARIAAANAALSRKLMNPALRDFVRTLSKGDQYSSQEFVEMSKGEGLTIVSTGEGRYIVTDRNSQGRGVFDSHEAAEEFIAEAEENPFVGMADGSESDIYHLINPSEFLAGMAGRRFAAETLSQQNKSRIQKVVGKIKSWIKQLIKIFQDNHRPRADVEAIYEAILRGDYVNNLKTGARFERAYSVGATGQERINSKNMMASNAEEAQRLIDAAGLRGTDAERIQRDAIGNQIGEPIAFLRKHASGPISDLTDPKKAKEAKNVLKLLGFNELESIEKVSGQSAGYRSWASIVGVGSPINAVMARESASLFNSYKAKWRQVKETQENLRKEITSDGFLQKFERADAERIKAESLKKYVDDFDAHSKIVVARAADARVKKTMTAERAAVLLAEARELRSNVLKGPHRSAVSNAISDIIAVLTKDQSAVDFLLQNHQNPEAVASEYRKARRRLQKVDGRAEIDDVWVKYASEAIARTEGKIEDMIVATMVLNDAGFRAGLNEYQNSLFSAFQSNPERAIQTMLTQRGKWSTKADRTHQAFRRLMRPLEKKIEEYVEATRAANIVTAIESDPDIRVYDNIVNREAEEVQRPDYEIELESGKKVHFKDIDPWRLGDTPIIHRPYHPPIQISFEANTDEFAAEVQKLENVVEEWRLWKEAEDKKPENLRDPYYEYFTSYIETTKALVQSTMASDPALNEKLINLGLNRLMNNAEAMVDELQTRVTALAKNSSQIFKRTHRLARNLAERSRGKFVLKMNEAARSMGFDEHRGFNSNRNVIDFYNEVLRPLLASATNKDFVLKTGMIVGEGHKVTREAVDVVRFMNDVAAEGFNIVQKQIPQERSNAFPPIVKQFMENLGYTSFGKSIRTGEITVPFSSFNHKATKLYEYWSGRRKMNDSATAREAVGKEWDLIFSYMQDRASVLTSGISPLEEAYAYVVEQVQVGEFGEHASDRNIDAVAQLISNVSSSGGLKVPATEIRNQILNELEEVMESFGSNIDDIDPSSQFSSSDKATSFTRRRGARTVPYYFLNYGWDTTGSLNGFFASIHSFAYGNFAADLAAAEKNINDQKTKLIIDYKNRLGIIGDSTDDKRRVNKENRRDALNGKTILKINDADRQLIVIKYQLENLNKVFGAGGRDVEFDNRIRHQILSASIGMLITGSGTLIRNAVTMAYMAKHFGIMQDSMFQVAGSATWDLFYEGLIKMGISGVASTAKVAKKHATSLSVWGGLKVAGREFKQRKGIARLPQAALLGIFETLRPVYEEMQDGLFDRLESYKLMNDNNLISHVDIINDSKAEIEQLFNGGIIEDKDINAWQAMATVVPTIFDAFILSPLAKGLFPRVGDTITNIGITKRTDAILAEQEKKLRRLWMAHKEAGTLNTRFDLDEPLSRNNRLVPEELFSSRILHEAGRQQKMNFLEQYFEKSGKTHQQLAIEYIAELERTNGSKDIRLIGSDTPEYIGLMGAGLEVVNVASAINRPWWTRSKSLAVQTISALQGWNSTAFRGFSKTLSRPMKSGIRKGKDDLGRPIDVDEVNNPEARKLLMWALLTGSTGVPILAMNILQGISAEELIRFWMRIFQKQERATRQPWEHDTNKSVAMSLATYAAEPIPYVASVSNIPDTLAGTQRRASFDMTPVMLSKLADAGSYFAKSFQSGDFTYGLERLVSGTFPLLKPFTIQHSSKRGLNHAYNATRLFSRNGDEELLRSMSAGHYTANELTPFGNKMVNAAMLGNDAELVLLFKEAVDAAKKLKRSDPVRSAQQAFISRNPYNRAFQDRLTPVQRKELLERLNDRERAIVLDVEEKFRRGASLIGTGIRFTEAPERLPSPRRRSSNRSNRGVPRQSLRDLN